MVTAADHHLPPEVAEACSELAPQLRDAGPWRRRRVDAVALERLLAALDRLPPDAVARAEMELPWALGLFRYGAVASDRRPGSLPATADIRLLHRTPGLEHLYLFHRDGFVREVALARVNGPVRSAFFVAAIAIRMNDWAAPVRAAAAACVQRAFPSTSPERLARAGSFLFDRYRFWRRWTDEAAILQRELQRPDVVALMVNVMIDARQGAVGTMLRAALRVPGFDRHLPAIALGARQPFLRAIAFQVLIRGEAVWPTHRERRWVDKSMGIFRFDWVYDSRPVQRAESAETWLAKAALDRCAAVRKIAVIALLRPGCSFANGGEVAALLADDPHPKLRERGRFALDMQTGAVIG